MVSPYIKLDAHFKNHFSGHKARPDLHLLLVFGKNEADVKKSLNKEDLDFFKDFPNVSIIHEPRLHAKYYGNEKSGIITSINLYDFSFKNNIEFGVYSERNALSRFSKSADDDAWNECLDIAENGTTVFIKRPVYKSKFLGLSAEYQHSKILLDNTALLYGNSPINGRKTKSLSEFPEHLSHDDGAAKMQTREEATPQTGFCIRTGVSIPFNPARPFCEDAYKSWAKYKDPDYKEKFCHRTGKPSGGKTSMRHPILG